MIWGILLLGLILRLISLNQSLWLDEAINTLAVQKYQLFDLITQYARADFHPPGWFIILKLWTKLFGYFEIAVRMPSVIFGVLNIWVVYLIGKKLVSKELGLLTALLICLNPLHIYYSQEARMYAMATLAVSINMLLLIKLVKGERQSLIYLVLSNAFVFASDYLAYFIFPAQLTFLFFYKKEMIKKWFLALGFAAFLGIWWLPVFLSQFNVGSVASANLPTWKFVTGTFDFKTIPLTFVKFIIGKISISDKFIYAAVLFPVCSLFIYLLHKGVKITGNLSKKLLLSWIIIPPFIATVISTAIPIYNYFRVLFCLPGFLILVSLGILSLKRLKPVLLITVVLIELFCSLVYLLNPMYQREDWKGVVNFFTNQKGATILFESSGVLPPFEYYANGKLNARGALRDFPARKDSDVADFTGVNIYLVDYLVLISDPDRLVAKRLVNSGYRQTDIKNFNGVGFVYQYVKE